MSIRSGYFDRSNLIWIDSSGKQINKEAALPYIKYREQLDYTLNIMEVGQDGVASQFTGWATGGPYSLKFVIDNDRVHYQEGTLNAGLAAGPITQIDIAGLSSAPQNSGRIILEDSSGNTESIDYTAVTLNGSIYEFTVSATITNTYSIGDRSDVVDPVLVEVENADIDQTNIATGVLIVSMSANTIAFRDAAKGLRQIDNTVFELQVWDASGNLVDAIEGEWTCQNLLFDELSNPPTVPVSDYYNKTQADARYIQREDYNTPVESVSISSGAATLTKNVAEVSAETGTADDLDTISSPSSGNFRWLYPASGDTITIKHGTGNIITPSGADVVMAGNAVYSFMYDGFNWRLEAQIQASGSGDVTGPGSSTDTEIAIYNGTTGKIITTSGVTIDGSANIVTAGDLTAGEVFVDDDAYAVGWNGSLAVPTKNAVYDKIEGLSSEYIPQDLTSLSVQTTLSDSDILVINDSAGNIYRIPASLLALASEIPTGLQEIATLATDVNDPLKNNFPVTYQIDESSQDVPGTYILLCHCSGSDGDTTFVDHSDFAHTISLVGNPEVDTDITKFGATVVLDGNDGLTIVDDNIDFSSNDFHISCWFYVASGALTGDQNLFHLGSGDGTTEVINAKIDNGEFVIRLTQDTDSGWGETLQNQSITISEETWYHFALERSGDSLFVCFNGVVLEEYSMAGKTLKAPDGSSLFRWGHGYNGSTEEDFFTGNLDELTIVIGSTVLGLTEGDTVYTVPTTQAYTDQVYDISDTLSPDSSFATFTDADLTAGVYTFNHGLGTEVVTVAVYEDASPDAMVIPDAVSVVDSNNTNIDLSSYGTISGNWRVIAIR